MSYLLVVIKANGCEACQTLAQAWPLFIAELKAVDRLFSESLVREVVLPSTRSEVPPEYPRALSKFRIHFPTFLLIPSSEWEMSKTIPSYEYSDKLRIFSGSVTRRGTVEYHNNPPITAKNVAAWYREVTQQRPPPQRPVQSITPISTTSLGTCSVHVKNRTYT